MGSAAAAPAQRSSGAQWWHVAQGDRGTVQLGAGSNFFSEAVVHWHRVSREQGSPDTGGVPEPRRSGTEGCGRWARWGFGLGDLRRLFQPSWLCDCMTTPSPACRSLYLWPLGTAAIAVLLLGTVSLCATWAQEQSVWDQELFQGSRPPRTECTLVKGAAKLYCVVKSVPCLE